MDIPFDQTQAVNLYTFLTTKAGHIGVTRDELALMLQVVRTLNQSYRAAEHLFRAASEHMDENKPNITSGDTQQDTNDASG